MGHRKIETTLIYTQLLQFDKDDNYTCKVAQNVEHAADLIENGFEYVTENGRHQAVQKTQITPFFSIQLFISQKLQIITHIKHITKQ
jgi:hypothetical protein